MAARSVLAHTAWQMSKAWRRNFLQIEFTFAAVCTAMLTLWTTKADQQSPLRSLLEGRRTTLYGTLAGIEASLLGFALATVAIVLGFTQTERFELLRQSRHYPTLLRTFISGIRALAGAAATTLLALFVDSERHPNTVAMLVCSGFVLLSTVRVARLIWALERIIAIMAHRPDR